ncbi:hypothetical protein ABZ541_03135 [Micromonospora sediminicola]|uniref:hypothetical protein n=1 Tax=Micromonospora sediminicola TaxID=946078 RepID=UPI0033E914E6
MPVPWWSSAEVFAQHLAGPGVDTTDVVNVVDVEAAWLAFGEFLQVEVDGVDPYPASDADGFIVQWGSYSWNGYHPSLTFTRQFAIAGTDDQPGSWTDPEYWQVSLEMCFEDGPDLTGIAALPEQDTGFNFAPVGPRRQAALAKMRSTLEQHSQLRAAWRTKPAISSLTIERAD